jgi:hypothetical protein
MAISLNHAWWGWRSETWFTLRKNGESDFIILAGRLLVKIRKALTGHLLGLSLTHAVVFISLELFGSAPVSVFQKQLKGLWYGNKPNASDELTDEDINKLFDCSLLGVHSPLALVNFLHLTFSMSLGMRGGKEHIFRSVFFSYGQQKCAQFFIQGLGRKILDFGFFFGLHQICPEQVHIRCSFFPIFVQFRPVSQTEKFQSKRQQWVTVCQMSRSLKSQTKTAKGTRIWK